jgi:2-polyprenyl-3-methyl-5-hydroxy-6-metoxy-1,4-benzoquinol methylase
VDLSTPTAEAIPGLRFGFGENWQRFLSSLTEQRIATAEETLRDMLGVQRLDGKSFLDIGSGSGIFSLAARRLGSSVFSFDYDPQSVACTRELRERYFPDDTSWTVAQGSALDEQFVSSLGPFDIVYSWGVLHHTGNMWAALANAALALRPVGQLFVSIYNDEGPASRRWARIKKAYNRSSKPVRAILLLGSFVHLYWRRMLKDLLLFRPGYTFRNYRKARGMSLWRDLVDWVGGYPFEVAKPAEIVEFYRQRGFVLQKLVTCNNLGCNEFVFCRQVV